MRRLSRSPFLLCDRSRGESGRGWRAFCSSRATPFSQGGGLAAGFCSGSPPSWDD